MFQEEKGGAGGVVHDLSGPVPSGGKMGVEEQQKSTFLVIRGKEEKNKRERRGEPREGTSFECGMVAARNGTNHKLSIQ